MARRVLRMYWAMQFAHAMFISISASIYTLYLRNAGLSYQQAYAVNAVFMIAVLILEVPTGVIADLFGRRLSFILANVFWGVAKLIYGSSSTIQGFLVAEIFAAMGLSLMSGALGAWVVDEIQHYGNSDIHPQDIFGYGGMIIGIGHVLGAVAGGFLCSYNMRWGWYAGGIGSLLLAAACALWMPENGWRRTVTAQTAATETLRLFRASFGSVFASRALWGLFLINGLIALATQGLNMGWQPFFAQSFETRVLGAIASGMFAFLALGSLLVARWNGRISNPRGIAVTHLAVAMSVILAARLSPAYAVIPYMLHEVGRGTWTSVQDIWANHHISDNRLRATILSINSLGFRVFAVPGLLVAGGIADARGISASWVFSACVLVVAALSSLRLLKNA